ncbi:MAG: hypothetical protein NW208_00435 [Bryobacter sp.]|nr:hypothetical protein [Bryobacter sp.]
MIGLSLLEREGWVILRKRFGAHVLKPRSVRAYDWEIVWLSAPRLHWLMHPFGRRYRVWICPEGLAIEGKDSRKNDGGVLLPWVEIERMKVMDRVWCTEAKIFIRGEKGSMRVRGYAPGDLERAWRRWAESGHAA